MNRTSLFEHLIEFTKLRLLGPSHAGRQAQQAPPRTSPPCVSSQREAEVLGGGPQPAVRLLDNSEDIAEEYSKSSGPFRELAADAVSGNNQVRGREISGIASPGKENREITPQPPASELKSPLFRILSKDFTLDFECEQIHVANYAVIRCDNKAIGVCKHCRNFVCKVCCVAGECYAASRHQVSLQ